MFWIPEGSLTNDLPLITKQPTISCNLGFGFQTTNGSHNTVCWEMSCLAEVRHSWFTSTVQQPSASCCSGCYLFISCLRMPVLPHCPFSSHWSFLTRTWEGGGGGMILLQAGCPLPPKIRTQSAVSISAFFLSCMVIVFIYYSFTRRTNDIYF